MPDLAVWLLLAAVALGTSTISAVVGLAGGMLLLAALLQVLDPVVAIPIHGVVQLASNASRTHLQRAHVRWDVVRRFALPLIPAAALGLGAVNLLPPDGGRLAIGVFALLATWTPNLVSAVLPPSSASRTQRFLWAGALVGFANMVFGATGPLLAPFVLSLGLPRQPTVGTLAACQTLGHLVKIALFGLAGFAFAQYALPVLAMCLASIVGSAVGTRLLERLDERSFRVAIRWLLTLVALRLVLRGLS